MALQHVTRVSTSLRPLVANLAHLRLANRKILEVPSVIFMREMRSSRSNVQSSAALCLPNPRFIIPDATLDAFDLKDDPMGTSTISNILGSIFKVKNSALKPADELHVPQILSAEVPLSRDSTSTDSNSLSRKVREDTLVGVAVSFAARGRMHISRLRGSPTLWDISAVRSKDLNPLTALQSSPGGGKTTVLNMMALLSSNKAWTKQHCPDDAMREVLNNSIAVPVTFNSGSDWDDSHDINPSHGLAARILYSFFIKCDEIDFTDFIRLLPASLTPKHAIDACRVFMHSTNPSVPIPPILLLIDETRKTMNENGDNSVLTTAMGKLLDKYQYNKLNLVCTALDSYLVNKQVTKSKRAVQWVALNSLQQDDAEKMFLQALERVMPSHMDKLPHVKRSGNKRVAALPPAVRLAISDCAGHPRSLEKVQRAFHTLLEEFTSASDWRTKDSLHQLRQLVCLDLGNAVQTPSVDAIRAALVGTRVKQESMIGGKTFADLIAAGTFLNTGLEGDDEAIPKLSMFSLLRYSARAAAADPPLASGELQKLSLAACIRAIAHQEEQALVNKHQTSKGKENDPSLEGMLFEKFIAAWLQMRLLLIEDKDQSTNLNTIFHLDEPTTATYKRNIAPGKVEFVHLSCDTFESFMDKLSLSSKLGGAQDTTPALQDTAELYKTYVDVTETHKAILFGRHDIDNPGFDMIALLRDTEGKKMCLCIETRFSMASAKTIEEARDVDNKWRLFRDSVLVRLGFAGPGSGATVRTEADKKSLGVSDAKDIFFVNVLNRTALNEDRSVFLDAHFEKLEENVILLDREMVRTFLTPSLADRALFLMDLRYAIDPTSKVLEVAGLRAGVSKEDVLATFAAWKPTRVHVTPPPESEKHLRLPRAHVEFKSRQAAEEALKAVSQKGALDALGESECCLAEGAH